MKIITHDYFKPYDYYLSSFRIMIHDANGSRLIVFCFKNDHKIKVKANFTKIKLLNVCLDQTSCFSFHRSNDKF